MERDDKKEHARILKSVGRALRGDMRGLTDTPPPRPIAWQILRLIHREQERRTGGKPLSWEELPDDLRQLLEHLKAGKRC
jgi:hypothetical protein